MGMLDYLQEEWRNLYKPFQRYPTIYGKQARQGWGMLTEDAPGAWDIATKPLGALMMSGIPSLYEAFRDEPIRSTLINDLDIDPKTAGYATQAIGLGMDVGAPWAVMRKGMTPWISEQVAKQANPSGFNPSRRRFLKGAGATAVGTATGIPMLKQVAKQASDPFGSLLDKMSSSLDSIGVKDTVVLDMGRFSRRFQDLAEHLVGMRRHREDMITDPLQKAGKPWARKAKAKVDAIREWRKAHPVKDLFPYTTKNEALPGKVDAIRDRVRQEDAVFSQSSGIGSRLRSERLESGAIRFGHIDRMFGDINVAKAHYDADPKGFILALEDTIKKLRKSESEGATFRTYGGERPELIADLENFLKELKAGL